MEVTIFKRIFKPRLAEHVPGERRVYKNLFGKTVRTVERMEEKVEAIDKNNILQSMKVVEESELQSKTKKAVNKINELAAMGKPIDASSFIVTDKNGCIERANTSLKSGNAAVRYKSSFENGDFGTAKVSVEYNF